MFQGVRRAGNGECSRLESGCARGLTNPVGETRVGFLARILLADNSVKDRRAVVKSSKMPLCRPRGYCVFSWYEASTGLVVSF